MSMGAPVLESARPDTFEPLNSEPVPADRQDDWSPISPIPNDVGEPPRPFLEKLVRGARLAGLWLYRDEAGHPQCYIARYNRLNADGSPKLDPRGRQEKEFRPLTFCQGPSGKQEWRVKNLPLPRPL